LDNRNKLYFVSDAHLGFPDHATSLVREKKLIAFLKEASADAKEIFLVGDIFDYWYEFKSVVPRGFTRLLGTISEITDSGIKVHFFAGNHDMWSFGYLEKECGVMFHKDEYIAEYNGKRFIVAHGDGMGPHDKGYKFLKKIFTSKVLRWMFSRLHPNFNLWYGQSWSYRRRKREKPEEYTFLGEEKEHLLQYSLHLLEKEHYDYMIYGHRHVPYHKRHNDKTDIVLLGDWLHHYTYAVYDGTGIELKYFRK
jgi:UDP-2,3-diacylglucosamine hydrolase